jgi:hypothetical protein
LVRKDRVVLTVHADEEMFADSIRSADVIGVLTNGNIVERQSDQVTAESKYLFVGKSHRGPLAVVAKIGAEDKVIVITVYLI